MFIIVGSFDNSLDNAFASSCKTDLVINTALSHDVFYTISKVKGRPAEWNLDYFDFITDWNSTLVNDNSIKTNYGLPFLNVKENIYWTDDVEAIELAKLAVTARTGIQGELVTDFESFIILEGIGHYDYYVSNAIELSAVAILANNGYLGDSYTITLDSDIDLGPVIPAVMFMHDLTNDEDDFIGPNDANRRLWNPIGTQDNPFVGTFDGNGHTIYNMSSSGAKVGDNIDMSYAGLFGYIGSDIKPATVKNLRFAGSEGQVGTGYENTRIGTRLSIEPAESGK